MAFKLSTLKPRILTLSNRLPVMQPGSWRTDKMTSGQRGYDYRWQQRRKVQLRAHPLCCYCERKGIIRVATVADHVIAHRGNKELFEGELQSLCKRCHDSAKQREETRGG